jgi:hypothetical protein
VGNLSSFLIFSIAFSATFGYNVLNTVAEIEIEKVRKEDTLTSIRCMKAGMTYRSRVVHSHRAFTRMQGATVSWGFMVYGEYPRDIPEVYIV